jgi:O-antigen/teichoic acid export membrane protein
VVADYLYLTAGRVVSAVAQMVMIIILTLSLDAKALAFVLAVFSVTSIVAALSDLGLGTMVLRAVGASDDELGARGLGATDVLALAAATVGVTAFCIAFRDSPTALAAAPLFLWAGLERSAETRNLVLIGEDQTVRAAVVTGGRRVLALGLFLGMGHVLGMTLAFSVSLFVGTAIGWLLTDHWTILRPRRTSVGYRNLLRRTMPFAVTSLSSQLRNAQVAVVAVIVPSAPAAAFGLGTRIASPALLLFNSIANVLLGRMAQGRSRPGLMVMQKAFVATSLAAAGLVLVVRLLSPRIQEAVEWAGPAEIWLASLVGVSFIYAGLTITYGSIAVAHGRESGLAMLNTVTSIMCFVAVVTAAATAASVIWIGVAAVASAVVQALATLTLAARGPVYGRFAQ